MDQADTGESLGFSAEARLTLERVAKALHPKIVSFDSAISKSSSTLAIIYEIVKDKWIEFLTSLTVAIHQLQLTQQSLGRSEPC